MTEHHDRAERRLPVVRRLGAPGVSAAAGTDAAPAEAEEADTALRCGADGDAASGQDAGVDAARGWAAEAEVARG